MNCSAEGSGLSDGATSTTKTSSVRRLLHAASLSTIVFLACKAPADETSSPSTYEISSDGSKHSVVFATAQGQTFSRIKTSVINGVHHTTFDYESDGQRVVDFTVERTAYFQTSSGLVFNFSVTLRANDGAPETTELPTGGSAETQSFRVFATRRGYVVAVRKSDGVRLGSAALQANAVGLAHSEMPVESQSSSKSKSSLPFAISSDALSSSSGVAGAAARALIQVPGVGCAEVRVDVREASSTDSAESSGNVRVGVNDDSPIELTAEKASARMAYPNNSSSSVRGSAGDGALLNASAQGLLREGATFPSSTACTASLLTSDTVSENSLLVPTCGLNQMVYGDVCATPSPLLLASARPKSQGACANQKGWIRSLCEHNSVLASIIPDAIVISAGIHPGASADGGYMTFVNKLSLGAGIPLTLNSARFPTIKEKVALSLNDIMAKATKVQSKFQRTVGKVTGGLDLGIAFTVDVNGRYYVTLNEVSLSNGSAYILASALWTPGKNHHAELKDFLSGDGQSACFNFGSGLLGSICGIHGGPWWEAFNPTNFPDQYGFTIGIGVGTPGASVGSGYTWSAADFNTTFGTHLPETFW